MAEKEFLPILPAKTAAYAIHRAALGGVIDFHQSTDKKAARSRIEAELFAHVWALLQPKGKPA